MPEEPKIIYITTKTKSTIDTIKDLSPEDLEKLAIQQQTEKNKRDCEQIKALNDKRQGKTERKESSNTTNTGINESKSAEDSADKAINKEKHNNVDSIQENPENGEKVTHIDKRKLSPNLWKPGQSGNPKGKPAKKKLTITSLIDKKLSDKKEAQKFVDHLFELYYSEANKQALSAGIHIYERHEGKIKDVVEIRNPADHVPNQEEQVQIEEQFRLKRVK